MWETAPCADVPLFFFPLPPPSTSQAKPKSKFRSHTQQLSALNSQYRSQLSRTELSTSQLSSLTSQLSKINGEKKDKVQRLSQLQVQLNRLRAGSAGDEKSGRELSRSKGLLEVAVEAAQKELVGSREAREKSTASNFPTAPTTTTQIEDDDDDDEEFDEMLIAGPMFGSDNYH